MAAESEDRMPLSTAYVSHHSGQPANDGYPPRGGLPTSYSVHERVDPDAGSDTSSVGDDLSVASITSSIEDHLT